VSLRVYITGDTGLVGSRLVDAWQEMWAVAGCSRRELAAARTEHHRLDLAEDPRRVADVLEAFQPDVVVHTAAVSSPTLLAQDVKGGWRVNVEAAHWAAQWCRRRDRLLVAFSSDTVYADAAQEAAPQGGWPESAVCAPGHLYGRSKVDMERAVLEALPQALLPRSSLLWGRSTPGQNSFSGWLLQRLAQDATVPVFRDNMRHMLAVGALPGMLERLITLMVRGGEEARGLMGPLNVGGAGYLSREDFARRLFRHLGLDEQRLRPMDTAEAGLQEVPARELPLNLQSLAALVGDIPATEPWLAREYPFVTG